MMRHKTHFNLRFTATVRESRRSSRSPAARLIIAASGMCNAGRILHHLAQNLPRRQSAVLITGFQAQGTLGRRLVAGANEIRLFGQRVPVKARLYTIGGLSAHPDRAGLLAWLGAFKRPPGQTFVVHGEHANGIAFAETIRTTLNWPHVTVPVRGDVHLLALNRASHACAKKRPLTRGPFFRNTDLSDALDLFQHLESRFRCAGKHALEYLGKATTLKRVAAGAFAFGHD